MLINYEEMSHRCVKIVVTLTSLGTHTYYYYPSPGQQQLMDDTEDRPVMYNVSDLRLARIVAGDMLNKLRLNTEQLTDFLKDLAASS